MWGTNRDTVEVQSVLQPSPQQGSHIKFSLSWPGWSVLCHGQSGQKIQSPWLSLAVVDFACRTKMYSQWRINKKHEFNFKITLSFFLTKVFLGEKKKDKNKINYTISLIFPASASSRYNCWSEGKQQAKPSQAFGSLFCWLMYCYLKCCIAHYLQLIK